MQTTEATPNAPTVVPDPAPMSPPARPAQDDSPTPDTESRDHQSPASADEDSSTPITPPRPPPDPVPRPRRVTQPPKRYEPETGQWVT